MYKIYMYKNKINNKVYIGQTKNNKKIREGSNFAQYKECTSFYNGIIKYGKDNFSYTILKENLSKEDADLYEKKYILEYKSNTREYGYNLTEGGSSYNMSEDVKNKISNGVKCSEKYKINNLNAHCKKIISIDISTLEYEIFNSIKEAEDKYEYSHSCISAVCLNKRNTYKNKIWRYYNGQSINEILDDYNNTKQLKSNNRILKIKNTVKHQFENNREPLNRKSVIRIDKDGNEKIYESITIASAENNILQQNIGYVCNGKRKTAGGYRWKFNL